MLETKILEGKYFFFMKEPDYVIKIIATQTAMDDLEGGGIIRKWKDANYVSVTKYFVYRKPFGMHFRFRHKVDDNNNRCHTTISIEQTRDTNFGVCQNLVFFL